MSQSSVDDLVEARREYSAGFVTDVETDTLPPGLNEDVIRFISERKDRGGFSEHLLLFRP